MRISDWSSDVCSSDLPKDSIDPFVPIIFCTAFTDMELIERARDTGVTEIMTKPITVKAIEDREFGRASCRESVCQYVSISVVAVSLKKKSNNNEYGDNQ